MFLCYFSVVFILQERKARAYKDHPTLAGLPEGLNKHNNHKFSKGEANLAHRMMKSFAWC